MRNVQPVRALRPHTAQPIPRIKSGREQLISLIDTLLQSGVPEHELNDLFQILGCKVFRDERDNLNPNYNNHQIIG